MGSSYKIIQAGDSRSFDGPHPFVDNSDPQGAARVFIGQHAGSAFAAAGPLDACPFIAIELGQECLGEHTGEDGGREGSNVLGLARFRLGSAPPTALVELVRQPQTRPAAIAAARAALTAAGLKVAICGDFPGRIVDRLIRPYLNAALRRLDERLASAQEFDKNPFPGPGFPQRAGPPVGLTGPARRIWTKPGAWGWAIPKGRSRCWSARAWRSTTMSRRPCTARWANRPMHRRAAPRWPRRASAGPSSTDRTVLAARGLLAHRAGRSADEVRRAPRDGGRQTLAKFGVGHRPRLPEAPEKQIILQP